MLRCCLLTGTFGKASIRHWALLELQGCLLEATCKTRKPNLAVNNDVHLGVDYISIVLLQVLLISAPYLGLLPMSTCSNVRTETSRTMYPTL
jgi:hypothetical protein